MLGAITDRSVSRRFGACAAAAIGVNERGELDDPMLRSQIANFEIDEAAFRLAMERTRDLARLGPVKPAVSSVLKYCEAELNKRRYELLMLANGIDALEWEFERNRGGDLARMAAL